MRASNTALCTKIGFGLLVLFVALPVMSAERQQRQEQQAPHGGGAEPRGGGPGPMHAPPAQQRPAMVERVNHGSLRHADTHVVPRPVVITPPHGGGAPHNVIVHRDVDVDVHRPRFWNDFAFGRRWRALPVGCISVIANGAPYYYDDGVYYQPAGDEYQEVYPPVGADVPELPDGAVEIDAGNLAYYYAGGAFYVEQGGGYVIAPAPIGVTVPDLPPGAVEVSVNGQVAYQFNGIYYRPVFVDGVTQYVTFVP